MKHIFLFCIIVCLPQLAASQDSINPYNTQLPNTIELHYTDVYYCPMAPPALTDTSWQLSSQSDILRDSDGIFDTWIPYVPKTHNTLLKNWSPCGGTSLGLSATWQRFFTAKRDGSGNTHDIIVGGGPHDSVIISKNEDVDFRASGTVKMENGFHVMPGANFHAYQEPKWGDTVFTDDFTSLNRSKWYLSIGANDGYATASQCSVDSNVFDTLDPEATDGHALDIIMREDSCQCSNMVFNDFDSCKGIVDTNSTHNVQATFTSADLRACPWPYQERDTLPLVPAWQHAPYGKFEIREKIPQFGHHLNDWFNGTYEIDLNESNAATPGYLFPNLHYNRKYGPFKGMFHRGWTGRDSIIFVSHDANWAWTNAPITLFINNFPYGVSINYPYNNHDTVRKDPSYLTWPASLASDTTDSVTFYYQRYSSNGTDPIAWNIEQDSYGKWRKLYASYRISGTDTFRFSKAYQPTSITLRDSINLFGDTVTSTLNCHWEYNLNNPIDSGIIYLDQYDTFGTYLHSNTEAYNYNVSENPQVMPAMPFNLYDSMGGYMYHTYSVEILPHEMRFLMDSNVVYRWPDRMLPLGSPAYIPFFDRSPMDLWIGEADDVDSASFASHAAAGWPGFRDVTVGGVTHHAAHRLIDYVRYWDVPADVKIPNFPH